MHPPSERLDSSSAAATSAVNFPSFDIYAQRALRGDNHCMPPALRANYDHSWRNDAGYLKAAPRKLERGACESGRGKDSLAPISAPLAVINAKASQRAP